MKRNLQFCIRAQDGLIPYGGQTYVRAIQNLKVEEGRRGRVRIRGSSRGERGSRKRGEEGEKRTKDK